MVKWCPRHRIGYNDQLDAVCPQCAISQQDPPEPLDEDPNLTDEQREYAEFLRWKKANV